MPQQAGRIPGLCVPLPRVTGALMLPPIQWYWESAWCPHDHSPLFTLKNSFDVSPWIPTGVHAAIGPGVF